MHTTNSATHALLLVALMVGCGGSGAKEHPQRGGDDTGRSSLDFDTGDEDRQDDDLPDTGQEDEEDTGEQTPAEADAAELVAVVLPTELACGDVFAASVIVRNTGAATWTRESGYKLGAVDDSDSLYTGEGRIWLPEGVAIAPGQTHSFEFDLTAPLSGGETLTDWRMVHEDVGWFGETAAQTVTITCSERTYCDPLTDSSTRAGFADKDIRGGSFSPAGWQTTGVDDQIRLQMTSPISGPGSLEIDVDNFDPYSQYLNDKYQIINMYTSDNGSQDVFETDEAWWNIRTGTNYSTGLKILAAPNGGDSRDEARLIEDATWDPSDTHTFFVTWDAGSLSIYLDGDHLETLPYSGRVQPLQHVFIGTDNVYEAQVGPIYSNLCVTQ
jgi:hypothetical protein